MMQCTVHMVIGLAVCESSGGH